MVKMRRDGIHSTSEIHIMGEVKSVNRLKALSDGESQQKLASQRVILSVVLMFFEKL
jgi:hypothetical protein